MKPRRPRSTSDKIAGYLSNVTPETLSENIREIAKAHLLDGFSTMVAGAVDDTSRRVDRYLQQLPQRTEATVIGTRVKLTAQHAAFANGVRGHVLDYDDAQLATLPSRPFGQLTHPTTPVLCAALALAEKIRATGLALLTAYVAGVEVACRLADAIDPRHYLNGFHPTGTIGAFGATAACAHLLKLDSRQTKWALGIAGSLASGVRAHRGTMAKALNAGHAAENGVIAATLAQSGFTASSNIFDDPMGYFNAACHNRVDRRLIKLGSPYFFYHPGIAIKKYPCAAVLHPALDAIIELAEEHDLQPSAIKTIRVSLGPDAALPLVYDRPKSGLEAKFSLPFSTAVALVRRKAGLDEYTDETVRDEKVTALMKRVRAVRAPRLKSVGNRGSPAEVEIELKDGRIHRRHASVAQGHPKKPLSREDLEEKFKQCAGGRIAKKAVKKFIDCLSSLEDIESISPWLGLLRAGRS